jgi:hypothetical protein
MGGKLVTGGIVYMPPEAKGVPALMAGVFQQWYGGRL